MTQYDLNVRLYGKKWANMQPRLDYLRLRRTNNFLGCGSPLTDKELKEYETLNSASLGIQAEVVRKEKWYISPNKNSIS